MVKWRKTFPAAVGGFALYCVRRFVADGCPRVAASLSYASLLASIPLLAIAFGVLSYLPLFDEIYIEILDGIFANFLPEAGLEISEQVVVFLENARELTGVGFLALVATAYLLLGSMTASFNAIWRVSVPRPIWTRLLVQWIILVVWPLLILASVLLSSLWAIAIDWFGLTGLGEGLGFSRLLPFGLTLVAFAALYIVLPSRSVEWRSALVGALVATLLFEALKRGFGLYASSVADYEAIYGALAALPLVLVWMYLSWSAILIGAEIAAALPEWRIRRRFGRFSNGPSTRLALGLAVVERLRDAALAGRASISERALFAGLPSDPGVFHDVLFQLSQAGLLRNGLRGWRLTTDLGRIRLTDLMTALEIDWTWDERWSDHVRGIVGGVIRPDGDLADANLEKLLSRQE